MRGIGDGSCMRADRARRGGPRARARGRRRVQREAIGGIATFVEKLKGNLVWLGGTAMGLVIAVVGIMFMAGHSRAHDLAIRTLVGLAILASISGIVA